MYSRTELEQIALRYLTTLDWMNEFPELQTNLVKEVRRKLDDMSDNELIDLLNEYEIKPENK